MELTKKDVLMSDVLTIAGSPAQVSRSSAVLAYARGYLQNYDLTTDTLHVRELDAVALLAGHYDDPSIRAAKAKVAEARAVIVATPVYKAAYAGVLKAFLDLLPQDGLANKVVLPIATGGSPAHLLAIDYALKPVLSALGAQYILNGVYLQDAQLQQANGEVVWFEPEIEKRLHTVLLTLVNHLSPTHVHLFNFNAVAFAR